jgi:hypothetical protein
MQHRDCVLAIRPRLARHVGKVGEEPVAHRVELARAIDMKADAPAENAVTRMPLL